jgi:hypothetical protein
MSSVEESLSAMQVHTSPHTSPSSNSVPPSSSAQTQSTSVQPQSTSDQASLLVCRMRTVIKEENELRFGEKTLKAITYHFLYNYFISSMKGTI